ncbi:glutamate dehydrogenase/leucine dehydrogenase [Tamilnaduibacter salinus]|uniref:Glutamate dehydrogenase/leucine dehydrogenase n=1 Tax=Tamilnaduibacter salinus TaxID=1484056 RepID=A0A2U1D0L0_9GAMM|nr:Glu/Leu/Phe/Val dehydrogenase family protein [Tamilnaduibacter salinus]PVY78910.1 glutamate dehydrogenase/leucine dehydrogenase [Tamilnaduibacter salinus]
MFATLEQTGATELHVHRDPVTGLRAIIAIHSTLRGPAVGGCRCLHYPDEDAALTDVTRLARGMSYKAALSGLPHGGAKSVILRPDGPFDRVALYQAFGRFVDTLGGRYITAIDSGTELDDLDQVAMTTDHVWGHHGDGLDPSPLTTLGVLSSLEAAVRHQLKRSNFRGLHFAIQGLGHVGADVARRLADAGASLTLADLDTQRSQSLASELGAHWISADAIYDASCDGFIPCALGNVLNANTIPRLRTRIVAGSANNQLGRDQDAQLLHDHGILYAPDYIVNAGGLIQVAMGHHGATRDQIRRKVQGIGETLSRIFREAQQRGLTPARMADHLAEERLQHTSDQAA